MNVFPQSIQDRKALLTEAYRAERARLASLAASDTPQGDYAHPVFGDGSIDSVILLIGEAPGAEEALQGRPFVGKAGAQLTELMALMHIERTAIYITNVVKYRPVVRSAKSVRNRTPGKREVDAALPLLQQEIVTLRPQWIVTLGNTPLHAVCRLGRLPLDTVGNLHGRPTPIAVEGCACTLFPMYHPASGIYNRALIDVMAQDAAILGEKLVKA